MVARRGFTGDDLRMLLGRSATCPLGGYPDKCSVITRLNVAAAVIRLDSRARAAVSPRADPE